MFVSNFDDCEGQNVSLVGTFVRIDGNYVILKTPDAEIKVEHKGLGNYKSKYVLVSGTATNGVLVEDAVHCLEDDFNYSLYCRFAKASAGYPEVF
ncbi:hypothetical protein PAPHI01_2263 [Pancytospora philotis]|nr:hypothetical protein PAPHI01_2263 [Pancytospora philotis]